MADQLSFSNFAQTSLSASIAADALSAAVADSSVFPAGTCAAVIWGQAYASPLKDPDREIVLASSDGAGGLTIVRGAENTAPVAWNSGDNIANVITASVMNALTGAARRQESFVSVDDDYVMSADDSLVAVVFPDDDVYDITVTLPDAASCTGRRYTLINTACGAGGYALIQPAGTDVFSGLTGGVFPVCAGASCVLMPDGGRWFVVSYTGSGHTDAKIYSGSGLFSAAEGLVYADASGGMVTLNLLTAGAQGLPLTVVRADDSGADVDITLGTQHVLLHGKGSVVTVTTDGGGNISVLGRYVPDSSAIAVVSRLYVMHGHEKFIFADASSSTFAVAAPSASLAAGSSFTVIRKDTSANTVYVDLPGKNSLNLPLTASDSRASFVSDGSDWHRFV